MEQKHNMLVYPSWVNASSISFGSVEKFGFVTLATNELQDKINQTVVLQHGFQLKGDIKFLSERVGCTVAPQPWATPKEIKLFPRLLL